MNILFFVSRVVPPVLVVFFYLAAATAQAAEVSEPAVSSMSAGGTDAVKKQGGRKASYLRYDLGDGRQLFVNAAKSFESYDNWVIDPGSFELSKRQRVLGKRDRARLQKMLVEARVEQTESFGGKVVKTSSPCTLKQRVLLKKLRLNASGGMGSQVNFVKSFGSSQIVAEIRDSMTDEVVFIYTEDISLGGGVTGSGAARISRLSKAIKVVMANAHNILVHALPLREERIQSRAALGCAGQLGQNAIELRKQRARVASQ